MGFDERYILGRSWTELCLRFACFVSVSREDFFVVVFVHFIIHLANFDCMHIFVYVGRAGLVVLVIIICW